MLENLQASELLLPLAIFNLLVLTGMAIAITRFRAKSIPETSIPVIEAEGSEKLSVTRQEAIAEFKHYSFDQIQSLLTQYPTLIKLIELKPDLPAKNLVASLQCLDSLIRTWELEPIGIAWQQVNFDPQLHQPDSTDIKPGDSVYVRFVGYRCGEQILVPAKVSYSLPGGAQ